MIKKFSANDLGCLDELHSPHEPEQCQSNYWMQTLLLDADRADQLELVLRATNAAAYMTRPVWVLMHELAPFKDCPRMDLANAQSLSQRLINIPSSSGLV